MSFVVEVDGRRVERLGARWAPGSDPELVAVIEVAPAVPLPLVMPSPVVPVDWGDEVWTYLHTLDALRRAGLAPAPVEQPVYPELPPLPDGAIA